MTFRLHLMKINNSKRSFPSLLRSGLNIFPATLNSRSTGPDVAGMTKYILANCANARMDEARCFQFSKGLVSSSSHGSIKYFFYFFLYVGINWTKKIGISIGHPSYTSAYVTSCVVDLTRLSTTRLSLRDSRIPIHQWQWWPTSQSRYTILSDASGM